jgi:hypothetical protein
MKAVIKIVLRASTLLCGLAKGTALFLVIYCSVLNSCSRRLKNSNMHMKSTVAGPIKGILSWLRS